MMSLVAGFLCNTSMCACLLSVPHENLIQALLALLSSRYLGYIGKSTRYLGLSIILFNKKSCTFLRGELRHR